MLFRSVENALYHGVKEHRYPAGKKGLITLQASCQDGFLVVQIEDDGRGMNMEEQQRLQEKICTQSVSHEESYGLKNVHQRLQLYFGSGYSLHLRSAKGQGTTITLTVPIRDKKEVQP